MHYRVTDNRPPNRRDAVGLAGTLRDLIRHTLDAQETESGSKDYYQQIRFDQQTRRLRQLKRNLRWVRAAQRAFDEKKG